MSRTSCTSPELRSEGFGARIGEVSSSPARPSCTGAACSAEDPPGWLPEETAGPAVSGSRAGTASAVRVVKEPLPAPEESSW